MAAKTSARASSRPLAIRAGLRLQSCELRGAVAHREAAQSCVGAQMSSRGGDWADVGIDAEFWSVLEDGFASFDASVICFMPSFNS